MGAGVEAGLMGAVFCSLRGVSGLDTAVVAARAKKVGNLWEKAPLTLDHYIL
jgi:hypothetical protein